MSAEAAQTRKMLRNVQKGSHKSAEIDEQQGGGRVAGFCGPGAAARLEIAARLEQLD